MEKIRLRFNRAFPIIILALAFFFQLNVIWAEVKNVTVSVEVEIENDDVAAALEKARIQAFRQAIQDTLTSKIGEEERINRLKSPSQFIKSFRLLDKKEENKKLIASFACEVILQPVASNESDVYQQRFAFDFIWRPNQIQWPVEKLIKFLQSEYAFKVDLIRLNAQTWRLEGRSPRSSTSIYASMGPRFEKEAEVRLIKDLDGIFEESNEEI